jgi:hypothetical protein
MSSLVHEGLPSIETTALKPDSIVPQPRIFEEAAFQVDYEHQLPLRPVPPAVPPEYQNARRLARLLRPGEIRLDDARGRIPGRRR